MTQINYLCEALGGRALANAVFSCLGYQLSGSRFGRNWEHRQLEVAAKLRGREEPAAIVDQSSGPPNGEPSDSQTWLDPQAFLVQHSQQTGKWKAIAICGRWRLAGPCPGFARCVHDGASNQQRRGCRRRWDIQHVQHPDRGNNLKVVRQ
jgi:hypothetical protein